MARARGRLSRSEDFARVYRSGRSVANRYLVLYYFDRSTADLAGATSGPRAGFSVSKRLGSAVVRNRIKRLLREAYRAQANAVTSAVDLVFIAREPIAELIQTGGLEAVQEKMNEVLRKASLVLPKGEQQKTS